MSGGISPPCKIPLARPGLSGPALSPCTVRDKLLWPQSHDWIGQVRGLTSRLQCDEEGLQHCHVRLTPGLLQHGNRHTWLRQCIKSQSSPISKALTGSPFPVLSSVTLSGTNSTLEPDLKP